MTSQKVVLCDILTQAVALSGIEKEKVIINIEGDTNDYSFYADEQWIGEAIINVLVNSYEFIKEKSDGKIIVFAIQKEDKCIISISDNGDGIKIEDIENIFDRFHTTKTPSSFHVGIGLNLAKLIIEAHHGSIYASNSTKYGGAQFRIIIPRYLMLSEKTKIEKGVLFYYVDSTIYIKCVLALLITAAIQEIIYIFYVKNIEKEKIISVKGVLQCKQKKVHAKLKITGTNINRIMRGRFIHANGMFLNIGIWIFSLTMTGVIAFLYIEYIYSIQSISR